MPSARISHINPLRMSKPSRLLEKPGRKLSRRLCRYDKTITMLRTITESKKTTVRYAGDTCGCDRPIPATEIQALKRGRALRHSESFGIGPIEKIPRRPQGQRGIKFTVSMLRRLAAAGAKCAWKAWADCFSGCACASYPSDGQAEPSGSAHAAADAARHRAAVLPSRGSPPPTV